MAAQAKSSPSLPQIVTLFLVAGLIIGLVITTFVSIAFKKPTTHQGHVEKAQAGKTEGSSSASSCRTAECLHEKEKREAPPPPPPLCLEEKFDKLPKHFLISEKPVHIITKGGRHCLLKCMDEPPPPCIIGETKEEEEMGPPEDEIQATVASLEEVEEESEKQEEKEVSEEKEDQTMETFEEGEDLQKEVEAEEEAEEEKEETQETKEDEEVEKEEVSKDVDEEEESKASEGEDGVEEVEEVKSEVEEPEVGDEEAGEGRDEEATEAGVDETEEVGGAEEGGQAEEVDEAEEVSEAEKETEAIDGETEEGKPEDETAESKAEDEDEKDEGEQEEAETKEAEAEEITVEKVVKDEETSKPPEDETESEEKEIGGEGEKEQAEEAEEEQKEKEASEEGEEEVEESEAEEFKETFEHKRITDYIDELLHLDTESMTKEKKLDKYANDILKRLQKIYQNTIKPIEKTYKYTDLYGYTISDGEIFAKPMVLVIGPWSSGKTAFINYLLDTETGSESLLIGAEPTTTDFTIIQNGNEFRAVDGPVLTQDDSFSALEKFGQSFLERLKGFQFNRQILKKMTIIDTPGIIEGQERSYPFSDVCQWFIDHSDLILVLFDPTKLDVGNELDEVFKKLKGREAQIRVILNKADTIAQQELMRVYGTLYWSLSQLIENLEPPRVYVGSFWSKPFKVNAPARLFLEEEVSLLKDFNDVFEKRVMNKIAMFRQHAIRVRNHALLVDKYLATYNSHNSFFANSKEIARDVIQNPNKYRIYQAVSMQTNVSKFDLPDPHEYEEFFAVNPLHKFRSLTSQCSFFRGCPLDKLDHAVIRDLPDLLVEARDSRDKQCGTGKFKCPADEDKKRRLVKKR